MSSGCSCSSPSLSVVRTSGPPWARAINAVRPPSAVQAALGGLCPQCGARMLFDGVIRFAPRCRACGLDLSNFNVGDGPAAFLTLIIGAVITALALLVDAAFRPPLWGHVRSEEHTSELQSIMRIEYAVFCLKKKQK